MTIYNVLLGHTSVRLSFVVCGVLVTLGTKVARPRVARECVCSTSVSTLYTIECLSRVHGVTKPCSGL